jgi:hypothetical protein
MADTPPGFDLGLVPNKGRGLSAIRDTWGIDAGTYRKIHTELERGMREKNILGIRLQGFTAQNRLEEVVVNIQRQIQLKAMVTNPNVDQHHIQRGLRRMAQVLNQNKRRQIHRIHDRPLHSYEELEAKEQDSTTQFSGAEQSVSSSAVCGEKVSTNSGSTASGASCSTLFDFSSATIFVQRQYGNTSVCRPEDLNADSTGKAKQIPIHHLRFDRFLQVLADELQYSMEKDVLFYNRETGEKICLPTERAWRAALLDMYSDGLRKLDFGIDRRTALGSTATLPSLECY